MNKIPRRIAQIIVNSLKGGVVPRIGLPYIAVGRRKEIEALLHDVDIVGEGGASFRFVVGRYGSGKSFLLQTIRNHVMDRNFVVADADLSPERRLQGAQGQGLATYRELLLKELTPDRRLRQTNKRDNEIYVVTYQNAPNVVSSARRVEPEQWS